MLVCSPKTLASSSCTRLYWKKTERRKEQPWMVYADFSDCSLFKYIYKYIMGALCTWDFGNWHAWVVILSVNAHNIIRAEKTSIKTGMMNGVYQRYLNPAQWDLNPKSHPLWFNLCSGLNGWPLGSNQCLFGTQSLFDKQISCDSTGK